MLYTSTRDNTLKIESAQAIAGGISADGGLFAPTSMPSLTAEQICDFTDKNYLDRAVSVLGNFLTDFTEEELAKCVHDAYAGKFGSDDIAPLKKISNNRNILELWHGPTCAFKDMALQLLPHLLKTSVRKIKDEREIVILVATSGDTGKAALEGFKDVEGTKIIVFYPEEGVSNIQKLQMVTQEGENVGVCAIKGNFDDAQTGVKTIFTSDEIRAKLAENNMAFSSANSINWGRLAPQIVYYISAYADMLKSGTIKNGEKVNIVVPTGNFGNILAAYYAKCMGLPVNRLICASNKNNVLTDFIRTGVYDRNRDFHTTISPSMDILISSNLERLLFHLSGNSSERTAAWMASLSKTGKYEVDEDIKAQISELLWAGCCDDELTKATIKSVFESDGYLCDTHTAVGVAVYDEYVKATGDADTQTIIASTANPYKFSGDVLAAISDSVEAENEFEILKKLNEKSGMEIPEALASLQGKKVRFTESCTKETQTEAVFGMLSIN